MREMMMFSFKKFLYVIYLLKWHMLIRMKLVVIYL